MQNNSQKFENLLELAVVLGKQTDFQEILRMVSLKSTSMFDAEVASIVMINPRTQNTIKTIIKEGKEANEKRYRLVQTNVIGWSRINNQSFLTEDIKSDSRFSKSLFENSPVKSVMCVPLQSEADVIGYLLVINKSGNGTFIENELELLEKLAAVCAPYLSNAQKLLQYFAAPLPEDALINKYEPLGLLGKSKSFIEMLRAVEAAAQCDVRVLLEGQSGTGKELVAGAIHKLSTRRDHPFIAIDCGAIPEHLIESELFGHVKGAFTGATQDRKGLLEEANGGTLFMDEIANLPIDMQSKFMRVLQQGEIRPVGSNKLKKIGVRIIAASSSSLSKLVEQGTFREDLFYRLHVYPIIIPSLNTRKEDIALIANKMLEKFSQQQSKKASSFDKEVLEFMKQRAWTGNIRELQNFVERLVTLAPHEIETIDRELFPEDLKKELKKSRLIVDDSHVTKSLEERVADYEEEMIRRALVKHNGNQSKAARELRILVQTLRYKMKKLGIEKIGE